MTTKYKKAPLVEVIFELFYTSSEWNPTIPGAYYLNVSSKFPRIAQAQTGFGFGVGPAGVIMQGDAGRIQFWNDPEQMLIQLTGNMLTVNQLVKYSSWENFQPNIELALNALSKVLKINTVERFGLKYINKIDVGADHSYENFRQFFALNVQLVDRPFPYNNVPSMQMVLEFAKVPKKQVLTTTIATLLPEPPLRSPVLFELYFTNLERREYDSGFILNWINETAHKEINAAFESFMTDKAKREFDPLTK